MKIIRKSIIVFAFVISTFSILSAMDSSLSSRSLSEAYEGIFPQHRISVLIEMIEKRIRALEAIERFDDAIDNIQLNLSLQLDVELNVAKGCLNDYIKSHERSLIDYRERIYKSSNAEEIKNILRGIESMENQIIHFKELLLFIDQIRGEYCLFFA